MRNRKTAEKRIREMAIGNGFAATISKGRWYFVGPALSPDTGLDDAEALHWLDIQRDNQKYEASLSDDVQRSLSEIGRVLGVANWQYQVDLYLRLKDELDARICQFKKLHPESWVNSNQEGKNVVRREDEQ